MDLYEAVDYRRWVRTYENISISVSLLKNIENYCNHINTVITDEKVNFSMETYDSLKLKFQNVLSMKGLLKAPYYFAIIVNDLELSLVEAGNFVGQVSLYFTTKNIGSCLVNIEKMKQKKNQWVVLYAFGLTKERVTTSTRKVRSFVSDRNCIYKSEPDASVRKILMAAGVYPTSMLYQPYRFVLHGKKIHIFLKKEAILTKYQRMFLNFEIGLMLTSIAMKAEELWMNVVFKRVEQFTDNEMKKFEYCISCYII